MPLALWELWTGWIKLGEQGHLEAVKVELWLKAASEITIITLSITWTLTAIFHPEIIESNALKNYVGYNNPCVGWDFPPANYFGLLGTVMIIVMAWRYAFLHSAQTRMQQVQGFKKSFIIVADLLYAVSATIMSLLFIVGPPDENWAWHTVIFVQLIVFRYLSVLGSFLKHPGVPFLSYIYIVVYGALSGSLPILYFVDICIYKMEGRTGENPPIPGWITQIVDYTWFVCVALTTYFVPESPALTVEIRLDMAETGSQECSKLTESPQPIGNSHPAREPDVRRRSPARCE